MFMILPLLMAVLVIGALVDIIIRPDHLVQHLPKLVWVLLVILLPVIGSIVWFAVGREYPARVGSALAGHPRAAPTADDAGARRGDGTTEEQLAELEREIQFHEKQDRIARLQAELDGRRRRPGPPPADATPHSGESST